MPNETSHTLIPYRECYCEMHSTHNDSAIAKCNTCNVCPLSIYIAPLAAHNRALQEPGRRFNVCLYEYSGRC